MRRFSVTALFLTVAGLTVTSCGVRKPDAPPESALGVSQAAITQAGPPAPVDLTPLGTPIALITSPTGSGNKDISIIKDIASADSRSKAPNPSQAQYDTNTGDPNRASDWIGYSFAQTQFFSELVFQSGVVQYPTGGWFAGLDVQVRQNGQWVLPPGVAQYAPNYPTDGSGASFAKYVITFSPVAGDAIRLVGTPGGSGKFISVATLQVLSGNPCAGLADGTGCSDGDVCTVGDHCVAGVCQPGGPYDCGTPDQCHSAGVCQRATGQCDGVPLSDTLADGTARTCDDGNRCTGGDTCHGGTCMPGTTNLCTGSTYYPPVTDLGSLQGQSVAVDINSAGVVTGTDSPGHDNSTVAWRVGQVATTAFTWNPSDGVMRALPPAGNVNIAQGINTAGVVTGVSGSLRNWFNVMNSDPPAGSSIVLPQAAGIAINDAGTIAGYGYFPHQTAVRMFRLPVGGPVEVLTGGDGSIMTGNTTAMAIDNSGVVVGYGVRADGSGTAVMTDPDGNVIDLNSLLAFTLNPNHDWNLQEADAVYLDQNNGTRTILGWGLNGGVPHAFKLVHAAGGAPYQILDIASLAPYDQPTSYTHLPIPQRMNANGEIVGSFFDIYRNWPQVAFVWTPDQPMMRLNDLIDPQSGWNLVSAFAINDNRQIAGFGYRNGEARAYVMQLPDMRPCPAVDSCHAAAIRDAASGICGVPAPLPDGTLCRSGDQCVTQASCVMGACTSTSYQATCAVTPTAVGYTQIDQDKYAIFSYRDIDPDENLNIPYGDNNFLSISTVRIDSSDPRPPEWFQPGVHSGALIAKMSADNLSWTIGTAQATVFTTGAPIPLASFSNGIGVSLGGTFFPIKINLPNILASTISDTETGALVSSVNGFPTTVGATEGDFAVSSDGAATYKIPLWVPAGRAGMQPDLALSYNSRAGDGLLGVGWSITGLSSIQLCPRTQAQALVQNTEPAAVQINGKDEFCLDGEHLIRTGDGIGYGEYRTERDRFEKIVVLGHDFRGPTGFDVYEKSGRITTYGGDDPASHFQVLPIDADSLSIARWYAWMISNVRDRAGNSMSYAYNQVIDASGNEIWPSEIRYTIAGGRPGLRSVRFKSADRSYYQRGNIGGYRFLTRRLITAIEMYGPNPDSENLLRSYQFAYDESPDTSRTLLKNVKECDAKGVCKAPTTFSWESGDPGFDVIDTQINDQSYYPDPLTDAPAAANDIDAYETVQLMDVDGDGRDDYLYRAKIGSDPVANWYVRPSVGSTFAVDHIRANIDETDPASSHDFEPYWPIVPFSLRGDGLADIAVLHSIAQNGTYQGELWRVYQTNRDPPDSFLPEIPTESLSDPSINPDTAPIYAPRLNLLVPVDMNGDGRAELVHTMNVPGGSPFGETLWGFRLNQAGGLSSIRPLSDVVVTIDPNGGVGERDVTVHIAANLFDPAQAFAADLDRDGKTELIFPEIDSTHDDNDIPVFSYGPYFLATNLSKDNDVTTRITNLPFTPSQNYLFVDLNGDGLVECIQVGADGKTITVYENSGAGFLSLGQRQLTDEQQWFTPAGVPSKYRVIDYNGDGLQDILQLDDNNGKRLHPTVLQSNGDGTFKTVPLLNIPFSTKVVRSVPLGTGGGYSVVDVGDVNGDGLSDIAQYQPGSQTLQIYERRGKKPDHLKGIVNGIGQIVTVTYTNVGINTISDSSVQSYPTMRVNRGIEVVAAVDVSNGIKDPQGAAGFNHYGYAFSGASADLLGRGFLGFSQETITGPDSKIQTAISYDNATRIGTAYPYARLPFNTQISIDLDNGAQLTRSQKITYGIVTGDPATGSPYSVGASEINESEVERDATGAVESRLRKTVILERDSFGNIKNQQTTIFNPVVPQSSGTNTDIFQDDPTPNTVISEIDDYDNIIDSQGNTQRWFIGLLRRADKTITVLDKAKTVTRTTTYDYNSVTGLLETKTTEPHGNAEVYLRTTYGRESGDGQVTVTTSTDLGGEQRQTHVVYDQVDGVYPTSIRNSMGQETSLIYHPGLGVLAFQGDVNGVNTVWQYDGFGRLRGETVPGGNNMSISYEPTAVVNDGMKIVMSRLDGYSLAITKDSLSRITERDETSFDGRLALSEIQYDAFGRVASSSYPHFTGDTPVATTYTYDLLNRPLVTTLPDNALIRREYTIRKVTSFEPENNQSYIVSDVFGRPQERDVVKANGELVPTKFDYEPFGQKGTVTDVNGNVTTMLYDTLGRQTDLIDPDTGHTIAHYNPYGEIVWKQDANNARIDTPRDRLGRITSTTGPDGTSTLHWDVSLNGLGKIGRTESEDGVLTKHSFDSIGRPTQDLWTIGGVDYAIDQGYDQQLGKLQTLRYPQVGSEDRFTATFSYALNGGLQSVIDSDGDEIWKVEERDAAGRLKRELFHGSMETTRTYDPSRAFLTDIVTQQDGTWVQRLHYGYDPNGNLQNRTDYLTGIVDTFGYNYADEMTLWQSAGRWEYRFDHDDLGNLTGRTMLSGSGVLPSIVYHHDQTDGAGPHALTSSTLGTYAYDGKGNQIGAPGRTIDYTIFDLPKHVVQDGITTTMAYDAFGGRVAKSDGASEEVSLRDFYEKRTGHFSDDGTIEHVFLVPGEARTVAQVVWKESSGFVIDRQVAFLHDDLLGSTETVTNIIGTVVERFQYDPFGNRLQPGNLPAPGQAPSSGVNIGFTSQAHDDNLGFVDMRARIYDPVQGRFLTPDPLVSSLPQGPSDNPYRYVLNNPMTFVDPTGMGPDGVPDDEPPPPVFPADFLNEQDFKASSGYQQVVDRDEPSTVDQPSGVQTVGPVSDSSGNNPIAFGEGTGANPGGLPPGGGGPSQGGNPYPTTDRVGPPLPPGANPDFDYQASGPVGVIVKLLDKGGEKVVAKIFSKAEAVAARKAGENVRMATQQAAKAVEKAAHGGQNMLRHSGHTLRDGSVGGPHFQTPGVLGHTFWGAVGVFLYESLNPFDAISGELGADDMLGNDVLDTRTFTPSSGCGAVQSCL